MVGRTANRLAASRRALGSVVPGRGLLIRLHRPRVYIPGDGQPKKKLKAWRVSILRQRAQYLGTVEAPDERAAEAAAVARFELDKEQRKRLAVRELD